jgi:YesN/AraC family two-component response regulator
MENMCEDNIEKKIIEYVNQNYITLESQDQVANYFGYNYAYISRLFKKKTGVTMNKYITDKKVELAKMLIVENDKLSFREIASMCGYADAKYFSRVFKNETGFTPSEYRLEYSDSIEEADNE